MTRVTTVAMKLQDKNELLESPETNISIYTDDVIVARI